MKDFPKISRRVFIRNISMVSGGLILACDTDQNKEDSAKAPTGDSFVPNLFVELRSDGRLILTASRSEMGQGIRTSLTSVIADEMNADWSRVIVKQATGDDAYGNQNTDGSRSIRTIYTPMRKMGAVAREMLISVAAKRWNIHKDLCFTKQHYVIRKDTNEQLFYGELALDAAKLDTPKDPKLKSPDEFVYIGKGLKSVDVEQFVSGQVQYGRDIKLENMAYAAISRCPVTFGTLKSFDGTKARSVPGVIAVKKLSRLKKPFGFMEGVAVIGKNTWAALQGKKVLDLNWDYGDNESYSTEAYMELLTTNVKKKGKLIGEKGNVSKAFRKADKVMDAVYQIPHLVHAPMETPNATAYVSNGACEVWAPVQAPQITRKEISEYLEIDLDKVTVNVTFLGGGFGRKSKPDFVLEAVALSKIEGRPVQVIWTREDDIQNSYYHAISAQYLKASLKNGKLTAWLHRTAYPSITSTFLEGMIHGAGFEFQQGMTNLPYAIANKRFENGEAPAHVRIGWLRSVYNIIHGFSINVFVDELAQAAHKDPLDFRMELIGSDRIYPSENEHKLDTSKLKNVLRKVGENAQWGRELPDGHGLGIAIHYSFYTYVASIAEVSVIDNKLKVHTIYTVVDCGTVVNQDTVKAQLEGAAIFGMSLTYFGDISLKEGKVEQSNFHDYQLLRLHQVPNIEIEIVHSDDVPTGIGEPGVPVIAPAIINAIFSVTGKRYRSLPLTSHGLKM